MSYLKRRFYEDIIIVVLTTIICACLTVCFNDGVQIGHTEEVTINHATPKRITNFKMQAIQDLVNLDGIEFIIPPQTLAFRNCNPFNLRYRGQANSVMGLSGFAKFDTIKNGVLAGYKQILLDARRGHTIYTFIMKYAPPSENNTERYINFITRGLMCNRSTLVSEVNPYKLGLLMMRIECGMVYKVHYFNEH